jgi:uncharacterized DUF497 family protein
MILFDPNALTREDTVARGEQRFVSVGADSAGRILVIVYTHRGENLRLISARAATGRERRLMRKEYDFGKAKRGAVIPQKGKTRISIYIDDKILEEFRNRADAAGRGYQTMMKTLRRILREELKSAG